MAEKPRDVKLSELMRLEGILRVAALRKSCGVEPDKTSTVRVNLPPRYR